MAPLGSLVWVLAAAAALIPDVHGIRNATEIIRRLSRFSNKMVRPNDWTGQPTVVNVSLLITNFHAVDEKKMEFSMDMFYRRQWNDPRLQYTDGPPSVTVNTEGATNWFWIPDLFFSNAREVETHGVLKQSLGAYVYENGNVKLSAKLSTTFHCPMDLRHFPLDVQVCAMNIESYMHTGKDLDLRWSDVVVEQEANPPSFFLLDVQQEKLVETLMTGTYHRLQARFRVRRMCGHYLLTTFLPSCCVVLLSCLVYWLPLVALSERTFLSAFLFLAMTIITATSQVSTPQVGYAKAIDVWVVSCLLFVFFNVLEVIILYLLARSSSFQTQPDQFQLMKDDDPAKPAAAVAERRSVSFLSEALVKRIDWVLRVVYPCAFLLFNIIFWSANAN